MGLFNFKRTNVLPKPTSQTQEALYLLLSGSHLSRKDFMDKAWILNAPDCIRLLRKRGVKIETTIVKMTNKFGREAKPCYYSLVDVKEAKNQYLQFVNKSNARA